MASLLGTVVAFVSTLHLLRAQPALRCERPHGMIPFNLVVHLVHAEPGSPGPELQSGTGQGLRSGVALGYLPSSLLRSLRCPERNGVLPHGQVPVPTSGLHWAVRGHVPEQSPEGCHSQGGDPGDQSRDLSLQCPQDDGDLSIPLSRNAAWWFVTPLSLTFMSNHPLSLP